MAVTRGRDGGHRYPHPRYLAGKVKVQPARQTRAGSRDDHLVEAVKIEGVFHGRNGIRVANYAIHGHPGRALECREGVAESASRFYCPLILRIDDPVKPVGWVWH